MNPHRVCLKCTKYNRRKKIITHRVFVRMKYKAVSGYIHNREIYEADVRKLLDKIIML